MAISQIRLRLAGWLSIANILFFPLFYYISTRDIISQQEQSIININLFTEIISFALFVFLFLSFNHLLKTNFKFHKLTKLIYSLISLKLFGLLLSLSLYFFENLIFTKYAAFIISFSAGIIYAFLGFNLLKLNVNLYGMGKILSSTIIINGFWFAFFSLSFNCSRLVKYQLTTIAVCQKVVIGSAFAVIIRLVLYIMLAIVFFKASRKNTLVTVES
ncbi:MAG: hypothetical protein MGU50_23730 [Trichodesmium sp. MAG_R02]|nr:hypothetical protein [Trichodesmium sp. MAG_R02]